MDFENIKNMTIEEIDARMTEIRSKIDSSESAEELNALTDEMNAIEERKNELRAEAQAKVEESRKVAEGEIGETIKPVSVKEEERKMVYTVDSKEYRSAWLKNLAVRSDGTRLFGEMDKEEREAFTFLTTNTGNLVPTVTMNRIVELVQSMAPMYDDATKSGMTQGFAVPRHVSIDQGDATATAEAVANDDEQDTFNLLTIDGTEIKKHIVISRKMKWESIDAFEDWVVAHISKRIAVAKETLIISALDTVATGIAADNKVSKTGYTDANVRSVLALIKEVGTKVWYANSNTIYNGLAGIQDGDGRPMFLPSTTDADPLVAGRIYGGIIKTDENLSDNVVYVGVPASILANDFEKLFINQAIDPKTFESIVGGYSLFGAGLENPLAFVKVTFTPAQAAG